MTAFVRPFPAPREPAPMFSRGPLGWARANLFAGPLNVAITFGVAALAAWLLPPLLRWAFVDAVWIAPDGNACRAHQDGACWAFIGRKFDYLRYGSYPVTERWRVDVAEFLGALNLTWLLWPDAPRRGVALGLFLLVYPVIAFVLLHGGLGLAPVDSILWGGIFVSLLTALVGIVFALPFGVILALARRSRLPALRLGAVLYIELLRGVPFITILFMANAMLPLFLPEGWNFDRFLRPLVGAALFSAAYLAEEVRGGLQSVPRGQFEAAEALGLSYFARMRLVVLPQALTLVIPGLVGSFIGLFKDTTLVAVVGLTDFLLALDNAFKDPEWGGPTIQATGYAFAALFYYVCCAGMSRYAAAMEKRLSQEKTR